MIEYENEKNAEEKKMAKDSQGHCGSILDARDDNNTSGYC